MKYTLNYSDNREEFTSGSQRDSQENKGRFDLLPFSSLQRIAIHLELGARKYGERNWEKGQPIKRYISSGLRHVAKFCMGFRDEDHLAAACWNLMAAMWTMDQARNGKLTPAIGDEYYDDIGSHRGEQLRTEEQNVPTQDHKEGEEARGNCDAQAGSDLCGDRPCDGCDTTSCV